jgi:fused signal recognition particle receptor
VFSFFKSKSPDQPEVPEQVTSTESAIAPEAPARAGWAQRLKQGLAKTREKLGGQIAGLFGVGRKIDAELFEELETVLITADVGVDATQFLLDTLQKRVRREGLTEASQLQEALKEALVDLLTPLQAPLVITPEQPFILMLAGVNGAGKTTTIGKLAKLFQAQGKSVLLAAGDTFRAAAREQLQVWGERNNVTVVSQEKGDSAAVIFDAISAARARGIDIVLADTAGRLPTQLHLMEEIKKVKRVVEKAAPGAPHEVLLVLDANTGQNAVTQVKSFDDALGVTGLVLTKLDGTAKGGAIAAIAKARPIPVRYIGVGEGLDDLRPFNAREFVDAVFSA